ncbi:hypothetical protein M378DRAFT_156260 [Amanita muscaria Koide BX008]|uniref:Uncharacterized protein n=1 Tax=Amanita muscaria (strain Koide BX008) TaxID=946122 RepID=A0A0C2T2V2_AMAMK|nr:hypothetical protein M378DRAFT_156260 [Amanita muscaria Koide BX008]
MSILKLPIEQIGSGRSQMIMIRYFERKGSDAGKKALNRAKNAMALVRSLGATNRRKPFYTKPYCTCLQQV